MISKLKTMLINQVEWPLDEANENAVIYETDALEKNPAACGGNDLKPYRTALYIDKDGIQMNLSVSDAVQGGTWNASEADSITVVSHSDDFSALMLTGASYKIKNSDFRFITDGQGKNVNDFNGYGAVIGVYKGGRLTLNNCYLEATGVAKPSVYCYHESDVLIKDCISRVMGGKLYDGYVNSANPSKMIAPPWVLGITGNARGTNLTGSKSSMTVVNSKMFASQWGVMSTDMGSDMQLTVIDSDLVLLGDSPVKTDYDDPFSTRFGSGYGTYAIGNAVEDFYGAKIKVGTYASIVTGGTCTYAASKGSMQVTSPYSGEVLYEGAGKGRVTEIESDAFGIMAHGVGTITLKEGTKMHSRNASFLLKASGVTISVEDGSEIVSDDRILLQMMDNDDVLVGASMGPDGIAFNREYNEPAGWPSQTGSISSMMEKVEPEVKGGQGAPMPGGPGPMPGAPGDGDEPPLFAPPAENKDPFVHFCATDVTLNGNVYNGTGYYGEDAKKLTVTLGRNAVLDGGISATESIHVDENGEQNTHFTIEQYYYLGHVANRPFFNGDNDVEVTLESGAIWNVTERGLLTALRVNDGAVLNGTVLVEGKTVEVESGLSLEGNIEVIPLA